MEHPDFIVYSYMDNSIDVYHNNEPRHEISNKLTFWQV